MGQGTQSEWKLPGWSMRANVCAPKKSRCAWMRLAGQRSRRMASKWHRAADSTGAAMPDAAQRSTQARRPPCDWPNAVPRVLDASSVGRPGSCW